MHHIKEEAILFTHPLWAREDMKFALILNAINPRIGSVLIRGDKGTAKSARCASLADLLEDIVVVEDCPKLQSQKCGECATFALTGVRGQIKEAS